MMEYDDYAGLDPDTKLTNELVEAIQGHVLRDNVKCFESPWALDDADSGQVDGEAGKGFYTADASLWIEGSDNAFFVIGHVLGNEYKGTATTIKELQDAVWSVQDSIYEDCMSI
jgi:hypothetical protein